MMATNGFISAWVRDALFKDVHRVHWACIEFRVRAISHRLRSFGFEDSINLLTPRELVALACWMPRFQRNVLCIEAFNRGDNRVRKFLIKNLPEQFAPLTDLVESNV